MSLSAKLRHAPLRIASGAYILNSGLSKLSADDEAAKGMHGMATGTYPMLDKLQPKAFARGLGMGELAVGTVVLLPIVPPFVAGAALVGFSSALLNMYWNTPGLHREGDPRPTNQGVPMAKDVWLFGIGASLMIDSMLEPAHDRVVELEATVAQKRALRSRRARRKANKAAKRARTANADALRQARESAISLQGEAAERARKAAKLARERAEQASELAAARLSDMRAEYAPVAERARSARDAARQAVQDYGPVAADRARSARDAARDLASEYGPAAAEKARAAAAAARDAARGLADDYGPVVAEYGSAAAEKAKMARDATVEAGAKARKAGEKARKAGAKARKSSGKTGKSGLRARLPLVS
jgi:uncharacterized membrane protein YphA (DoxX/SURF4 family)